MLALELAPLDLVGEALWLVMVLGMAPVPAFPEGGAACAR